MNNKVTISQWIYPINQLGKMATVHSVFDHSFNLQIGGHLINVANYSGYLSSFGLYLPDDMFNQLSPYIQQGNKVKIQKQALTAYSIKGVQSVSWKEEELIDLDVKKMIISDEELTVLKEVLSAEHLDEKIGLDLTEKTKAILHTMAFASEDELKTSDYEEIAKFMIGRGKGLTPSGDDILVAYLSILKLQKDLRAEELSSVLAKSNLSTTDVSKEYVIASMQGHVNSLVYDLYKDLQEKKDRETIKKDVRRVMMIGHTSGKDLSMGLLLGVQK
ncbi:hypothetical protein GCM10025886_25480 [Tetragenococcus halophilus subsp. flandriensis]|nr:hypothetical protein GCM10025886_25480 [Tetragenococcus halophilus subsp. flandriensis]